MEIKARVFFLSKFLFFLLLTTTFGGGQLYHIRSRQLLPFGTEVYTHRDINTLHNYHPNHNRSDNMVYICGCGVVNCVSCRAKSEIHYATTSAPSQYGTSAPSQYRTSAPSQYGAATSAPSGYGTSAPSGYGATTAMATQSVEQPVELQRDEAVHTMRRVVEDRMTETRNQRDEDMARHQEDAEEDELHQKRLDKMKAEEKKRQAEFQEEMKREERESERQLADMKRDAEAGEQMAKANDAKLRRERKKINKMEGENFDSLFSLVRAMLTSSR
jgi:flagellar biosynthesis GTPase FlhF